MYLCIDFGQRKGSLREEPGGDTCYINDLGTYGGFLRTYDKASALPSQEAQRLSLSPSLVLSTGSLHGPQSSSHVRELEQWVV